MPYLQKLNPSPKDAEVVDLLEDSPSSSSSSRLACSPSSPHSDSSYEGDDELPTTGRVQAARCARSKVSYLMPSDTQDWRTFLEDNDIDDKGGILGEYLFCYVTCDICHLFI